MIEVWKPVSGYIGYYEVSNFGNVRSVDRYITRNDGSTRLLRGRNKKQTVTPDGYLTVKLSKGGVDTRFAVHRIVAMEFVDGFDEGKEVNHIDFNRKNNMYSNLEWLSHKDNLAHSAGTGRMSRYGDRNPNYKNNTLRIKYALDSNLSKEKQSRPGSVNGRAKKVIMSYCGDEVLFGFIRECARYLIDKGMSKSLNENAVSDKIVNAIKTDSEFCGAKYRFA